MGVLTRELQESDETKEAYVSYGLLHACVGPGTVMRFSNEASFFGIATRIGIKVEPMIHVGFRLDFRENQKPR